jgi:hypothetical protein
MPASDLLEIEDARSSLEYWERRRNALPRYRRAARREARGMAMRWEERLRHAEQARFESSIAGRVLGALGLSGLWVLRSRLRRQSLVALSWSLVPRRLQLIAGGLVAAWLVTALVAVTAIAVLIAQAA